MSTNREEEREYDGQKGNQHSFNNIQIDLSI
jgi:hypothetical protein